VRSGMTVLNQGGDPVMTLTAVNMLRTARPDPG
jgi:hypothetical protein